MKLFGLMVAAAMLAIAGCDNVHEVCGPELQEDAEVVDTCFVPKGHGSGSGTGFSTDGHMTFFTVDQDIPACYAVVFKCQHGKFVVEGERGEALYGKLSKGDRVIVYYCVKYRVSGDSTNACGLHFFDANPVGIHN